MPNLITALAIAILYFYPSDSLFPLLPQLTPKFLFRIQSINYDGLSSIISKVGLNSPYNFSFCNK